VGIKFEESDPRGERGDPVEKHGKAAEYLIAQYG
jgi:hypothetical protein